MTMNDQHDNEQDDHEMLHRVQAVPQPPDDLYTWVQFYDPATGVPVPDTEPDADYGGQDITDEADQERDLAEEAYNRALMEDEGEDSQDPDDYYDASMAKEDRRNAWQEGIADYDMTDVPGLADDDSEPAADAAGQRTLFTSVISATTRGEHRAAALVYLDRWQSTADAKTQDQDALLVGLVHAVLAVTAPENPAAVPDTLTAAMDPADLETLARTAVELWDGGEPDDLSQRQRDVMDRAAAIQRSIDSGTDLT